MNKPNRRQTKAQRECSMGILEMAANAAGISMIGLVRDDDSEAALEFRRKHPRTKGYPDMKEIAEE